MVMPSGDWGALTPHPNPKLNEQLRARVHWVVVQDRDLDTAAVDAGERIILVAVDRVVGWLVLIRHQGHQGESCGRGRR